MLKADYNSADNKALALCAIFSFLILLSFNPSNTGALSVHQTSDLSGVSVAVYNGGHSEGNLASRTALLHMFTWMGAIVSELSPDAMVSGPLNSIDILVIPAISPYTLRDEMTSICYDIIRGYVSSGGALFCITGGTYFEWDNFGLFDIELQGTLTDLGYGRNLRTININKYSTGPDLSEEPDSYSTLVWTGSYFDGPDMTGVNVVATYAENDLPCMVTFQYGSGAVFLSSPHPENEEGSERDGTDYEDELADTDSEWNLLLKVSEWLVEVTGGSSENSFLGPLLVIGIAAVMVTIFAGTFLVYCRRRSKH